jgi:hypothetical protein
MTSLKLLALDEEDLKIFSAHMQDAIMRVEDMIWHPGANRFAALMNRFDWQVAIGSAEKGAGKPEKTRYERRRSALRFDRVTSVQLKNIDPEKRGQTLVLLAINFEAIEPPSGDVELIFADDCSIRLNVECIEAELTDMSPGWKARSKPEHEGPEQEG